jgi:hypothetical protein
MTEIDFIQPKKIVSKLISVDILDKIRAEIEQITDTMGVSQYVSKIDVLRIIDKYKAESEETDADSN